MDINGAIGRYFSDYPPNTVNGDDSATACTLLLSGSLDLRYSKDLQDLLAWIIENLEAKKPVIVDLEFVNYISSTGIGAFTNTLIQARRRDTKFYLRNVQPKVRAIFTVLGLMDFFTELKADG